MRCLRYFLRGALLLRPIPDHRDFECWLKGQAAMVTFMGMIVIGAIFGLGLGIGVSF